ncbi:hypothetical protein CgunFtcFv8_012881 [Champsocephalus gunnari]|uniref:Uncharacterized protein n=1 Tax=Champsocephalus gunnari TaxID=52237 RepID=A0AAN8HTY9_CHAGU|nr:hypothetical protein CgunFtcFv8_012881 [Champsocephalus gunnari]
MKNKSRVFDLALWLTHHISISLLADVGGGVSDCGWPLSAVALCFRLWGWERELLTPYSPPKPKPQAAPCLMPPSLVPDLRGRPQASWTQPETPHSHHTAATNGHHPPAPDLSPKTLP